MSIKSELEDEDGGARARRRGRRRGRRPAPKPKPVNPMAAMQLAMARAAAAAQAQFSANENGRPNALYGLIQPSPATLIAAGAQVSGEITFNDDTWVIWIGVVDANATTFLLNSLKVNTFDMVKSGPVNLSGFLATVQRRDRPAPLTGRRFTGQTKVSFQATNVSANPAPFLGFAFHVNEPVCSTDRRTSSPAPSVVSWAQIRRQSMQMTPRRPSASRLDLLR